MLRLALVLTAIGALSGLGFYTVSKTTVLAASGDVRLVTLGTYQTGLFDEGGAEILAYEPSGQRIYVVNAQANAIEILDASQPISPKKVREISLSAYGTSANSVAVNGSLVAVAVEGETKQSLGQVVFFDLEGGFVSSVFVGALPDMVTFTPDGSYALVANEGEPNDSYTVDPEGSVSIIDLRSGVEELSFDNVRTVRFFGLTEEDLPEGMRLARPGTAPSLDLEPEYIAVSPDGGKAYVTLQENNAIAVIDIETATFDRFLPLGYKDFSASPFDASNEDGAVRLESWPVLGMYQPDAIASFVHQGAVYLVTANEGDSRDYEGYSEEARVADLTLDPAAFPEATRLQLGANLGRLKVTTAQGDTDQDGDFDQLYAYGGRSFSIWSADGTLVYDSGDEFERFLATFLPTQFNSTNDENSSFDDRSDDKGPEPEGVVVGEVEGKRYAFIGLERIGGVIVYDITDPEAPVLATYANPRNFDGDPATGTAGDLGPEGLAFVPAEQSPTGEAMLIVGNEVSGTTTLFAVRPRASN